VTANGSVVVSFEPSRDMRAAIDTALAGVATVACLPELPPTERAAALSAADALLAWNIGAELRDEELAQLGSVGLIQTLSAGVEHVPFDRLPPKALVASNAGGWAEPMAEHVLALVLALAKRLAQNHASMARGIFDQRTRNRELHGAVVAILGYGGIGRASARLFRAFGARIHAVSRSGVVDEPVERAATLDELDDVLAAADIVLISLPLTSATRGLIGRRELALMKPDAILVNVARAAIVDEEALYEHLQSTPSFSAGLDVWWQEPVVGGDFATRRPFFELPNLLGSPHNSANTIESFVAGARHAAENVARHLRGEPVQHLVDRSEYTR
jgi:phosphoglycerate dehydrogenase-like enzyme